MSRSQAESWKRTGGRAAAARKSRGSGGMFVKLKEDGDSVVFTPLQPPKVKFQRFDQTNRRYETLDGPNEPGANAHWLMNVYDHEQGAVRILDLSDAAFEALSEEVDDEGPVSVFRITRKGLGKDTRWKCKTLVNHPADPQVVFDRESDESNFHELHDVVDPDTVDWGQDEDEEEATPDAVDALPSYSKPGSSDGPDDDLPF